MPQIPIQQPQVQDIYSFGFDKTLNKIFEKSEFDNTLNFFGNFIDSSQIKSERLYQYVYKSGSQTINDSTWTTITWDVESFPPISSLHNNIVNNSKFFIEKQGFYEIKATISWAAAVDSNSRYLRFLVNNDLGSVYYVDGRLNLSGADVYITVSRIIKFSANDYIEVQVWHNHGIATNVNGTVNHSSFSIIRLDS